MKDFTAKIEKILADAEDCELIGRLATDPNKRDLFQKLAVDLRTIARDAQVLLAGSNLDAANHKKEDDPSS